MKFFNSHLSAAEIADAIDRRLQSAGEQNKVAAHLAHCEHCTAEFAKLEKTIGLMRRDAAQAKVAPSEALAFAKSLFRTHRQFEPQTVSPLKKIAAFLTQEVSPFAPVFGERSAASASERQMLFAAGDFDLDLRVRQGKNNFTLAGQLLGEIAASSIAKITGEKFHTEIPIAQTGTFELQSIPAGNYDLHFKIGETEFVVLNVTIDGF